MDGKTGSWEVDIMSNLLILANWILSYQSQIVLFVGLVLLLCGIAMGIQYLWQHVFKNVLNWFYRVLLRNPWQTLAHPLRRLHRQWSEKNLRAKMAKWKRELVANYFYDALSKACDDHVLSKHDKRRLMKRTAEFFDIPDLKRKNNKIEAIRKRVSENNEHKIGPKGQIPGGKPGENVVPLYEGLGHKWLNRKKSA